MRFSIGNKKLGKDTAILNITPAHLCPSRQLGLCKLPAHGKGSCYAMKAERCYPSSLPFRLEQMWEWDHETAEEIAESVIELNNPNRRRRTPIKFVRLSEAGDFRTQQDVDKASKIAELLEPAGITMYGYTTRSDLDYTAIHKNLTMNGTGFQIHNEFRPVRTNTGTVTDCCPGDCRACGLCKSRGGRTIEVLWH